MVVLQYSNKRREHMHHHDQYDVHLCVLVLSITQRHHCLQKSGFWRLIEVSYVLSELMGVVVQGCKMLLICCTLS